MTSGSPPALSVVMLCHSRSPNFALAVAGLRAQTVAHLVEFLVVTPSEKGLGLTLEEVAGFAGHRIVETGALDSVGAAKAAGVRAANLH